MTKILIVGENQVELRFLRIFLEKSNYEVFSLNFDEVSETRIKNLTPEIVIINTEAGDDSALGLCKSIRETENFKDIIIFLFCDLSDEDMPVKGFEYGASDYILKPVNETEVKTRIESSLESLETVRRARLKNSEMTKKVNEIMSKVNHQKTDMVFALAKMVQGRDDLTGCHLERIRKYVYVLSEELRKNPKYKDIITDKFIENIVPASTLHDIGKIGIPDKILLKPGKLTIKEFDVIKTHTELGYETLCNCEKTFGQSDFFEFGKRIAKYHHERPDGEGYPEKLKGSEIPLEADIMALVDVYDALRMRKVYKPAVSHTQTVEIIKENRGTQFFSDIVDAFLNTEKEFETIWFEYSAIGSVN